MIQDRGDNSILRGIQQPFFEPVAVNIPNLTTLAASQLLVSNRRDPPELTAHVASVNERFQWTTAQIGSLFKAIYRSGIVSEQDTERIKAFGDDLAEIRANLSSTERAAAEAPIDEAYSELRQLETLRHSLPLYREDEDRLSATILDVTSHEQGPLCSFDAAAETLRQYKELAKQIPSDHPLDPFLTYTESWVLEALEDWADDLPTHAADELARLKDNPDNEAAQQLLISLEDRLGIAETRLQELKTLAEEAGCDELAQKLSEASVELQEVYHQIPDISSPSTLPPVYGSEGWQKLMDTLPKPERGWLGHLLHPEDWSDRTKDVVFRLMAGMQLSQQGITIYQQVSNSEGRKALADRLQREVIDAVPLEIQEHISREVSLLERLLVEKFDSLHRKDIFEAVTKKYSEIRPALQQVLEQYGNRPPTVDELRAITEAYRIQRSVAASPKADPTKHMSFSEWWQALTTPEQPQMPKIKLLTAEETTPISNAPTILQRFSNLIGITSKSAMAPSQQEFIRNACTEKQTELKAAIGKAHHLHGQLLSHPPTHLQALHETLILTTQALAQSYAKSNRHHLSLIELADLSQDISDQLFAIQKLEQQLAKAMGPPLPTLEPDSILALDTLTSIIAQDQGARRLHHFLAKDIGAIPETALSHMIGHGAPSLTKAHVADTRLEGSFSSTTIAAQLAIAQALLENLEAIPADETEMRSLCCEAVLGSPRIAADIRSNPEQLKVVIKQLKIAQEIAKEIPHLENSRDITTASSESFRDRIIEQLDHLTPGESFFFPAGWTGHKNSHATAWEVTRQDNGKLTIRHYNTGGGIETYHYTQTHDLQDRHLHFTELLNVELDDFTSRAFLQGVWDLRMRRPPGRDDNWNPDDIYRGLMMGLGGEMSTKQYSAADMKLPQYVGICAMESIMTVIEKNLSDNASPRLYRFWGTLKIAVGYFDQHREAITSSTEGEERRRLIDDTVKSLAARSQEVANDGSITLGELAYVNAVVKEMNDVLKIAERQAAVTTGATASVVTLTASTTSPNSELVRELAYSGHHPPKEPKAPPLYVPLDWSHWTPDPATLDTDIARGLGEIARSNAETKDYLESQKAIREIALALPLDSSFWDSVTPEIAEKTLSTIASISVEYLYSMLRNDQLSKQELVILNSEDLLAQVKLMTVADLILHRYPNPFDMAIPSLRQPYLDGLLSPFRRVELSGGTQYYLSERQRPIPVLSSIPWREETAKLQEYWNQPDRQLQTGQNDFFGFHLYPADSAYGKNPLLGNDSLQITTKPLEGRQRSQVTAFFWLNEWAKAHPEHLQAIDEKLVGASDSDKVALLYRNMKNIAPLHHAFLTSYVTSFLLQGQIGNRMGEFRSNKEGEQEWRYIRAADGLKEPKGRTIDFVWIKNEDGWAFTYVPFGGLFDSGSYDEHEGEGRPTVNLSLQKTRTRELGSNLDLIYSYKTNHLKTPWGLRKRFDPNAIQLIDPTDWDKLGWSAGMYPGFAGPWTLSLQKLRELFNLSTVSSLQVAQTIGYFNNNPHLLLRPSFQMFFRLLMTEETLLETWLEENPNNAIELAGLCRHNLDYATKVGDVNAQIMLAGISDRLERTYLYTASKLPEQFASESAPNFPAARTFLTELINDRTLTEDQRALAHRERALTYSDQETLSPADAAELLQSVIYSQLYDVPVQYRQDQDMKRTLRGLIPHHFALQMRTLLETSDRDAILNTAQQAALPNLPPSQWQSPYGFPYYISDDGKIAINVLRGEIQSHDKTPAAFDHALLDDGSIARVFSAKPPKWMTEVEKSIKEVFDESLVRYRIITPPSNSWHKPPKIVQREIEGRWYELQGAEFFSARDPKAHTPEFPLAPSLTTGILAWYCPGDDDHPPQTVLANASDGKMRYLIEMEPTPSVGKRFVKNVERLDDNEQRTGMMLAEPRSPELASFCRFEAPEYILAWRRDDAIEQIELPRFGFTFNVQKIGEQRATVCDQLSGYALVEGAQQYVAELGDYQHYLHLQRQEKDGTVKEIVVMARQPLKEYQKGSYLTETTPNQLVEGDGTVTAQHSFVYAVTPQGQLIPTSSDPNEALEATLYLAMIQLAERHQPAAGAETISHYSKAKVLLEQIDQKLLAQREGLTLEAIEVLAWIAASEIATKDQHSDATAIQLKAAHLLLRNKLDYPFEILSRSGTSEAERLAPSAFRDRVTKGYDLLMESIPSLYSKYLTHLGHVDRDLLLTPAEERLLLTRGACHDTTQFKNRLDQLTQGPGSEGRELIATEPIQVKRLLATAPYLPGSWSRCLGKGAKEVPLSPASLMRDMNLSNFFPVYYAIAIGELPLTDSVTHLQEKMGLSLPQDITHDELIREMKRALRMYIQNPNKPEDELWPATILLAAATSSDGFPMDAAPLEADFQMLQGLHKSIEQTKNAKELAYLGRLLYELESKLYPLIIEPTTKLYQADALNLTIPLSTEKATAPAAPKHRAVAPPDTTFAQCIELRAAPYTTGHTLQQPVMPQEALDQLFEAKPPVAEAITEPKKLFSQAADSAANPLVADVFRETGKLFEEYVGSGKGISTNYTILDHSKLTELQQTVSSDVASLQEEVRGREDALLRLANKEHEEPGTRHLAQLALQRGTAKLLSLDELVRCLYLRDYDLLHQRNPALTKTDITQLFTLLQDYLLDTTHLEQQRKILGKVQELNEAVTADKGEIETQEAIRAFITASQETRHYDYHEHPEYLVFEYYAKTLIWESQIDTLDKMSRPQQLGALIELAMGMGKSYLIAPLLAWLNADGERLAAIVMPEALIESMAKDLSMQSGTIFGQKIRTIAIKRDPITVSRLTRLYDRLCEVRDNREVLLWTPGDIQSLFNQWVELHELAYEEYQQGIIPSADFDDKRMAFLKIFHLLNSSGVLTIDEVHKVFDILHSHKFTFGRPQELHADATAAATALLAAIVEAPSLQDAISWEFIPTSTGSAFTEETYHTTYKPMIVDAIIERGIAPKDPDFKLFFRDLSPEKKVSLRNYLLDGSGAWEGYRHLRSLQGASGQRIRNHMAVLKALVGTYLPATATQIPLVRYGPNQDGLIIPYDNGKPTIKSLFGSPLERLLYTAEYTLAKGIPESAVQKEIESLKLAYRSSLAVKGKVDGIIARFRELCGGDERFSLLHVTKDDYAAITEIVNRNPSIQVPLVHKYLFPDIKEFPKQIETSAHIFPLLSSHERAMSGTVFNDPTYPKAFQQAQLSDTMVKTLEIMRHRSPEEVATFAVAPKASSDEIISALLGSPTYPTSIIDASGDTLGIGNEALARSILAVQPTNIEGLVYYDGDTLKVLRRSDDHPILYDRQSNKDKWVALWDLPHTTGSDIPLNELMQALMLVSKHTTLVEMAQAAWRLRGLARGQTLRLMVSQEDRDFIAEMLKIHLNEEIAEGANLTLEQIMRYALLVQTLQESGNNYRAIQERMKMALARRVIDIAWNPETSAQDAFKIYMDIRTLFVDEMKKEPWDIWGAPIEEVPTPQALQELLEDWKTSSYVQAIQKNGELYRSINVADLFTEWQTIIDGPHGPLPAALSKSPTHGDTVEQRTESKEQSQEQTQQQTRQQTVQQVGLNIPVSNPTPRRHIPPVADISSYRDTNPIPLETFNESVNEAMLTREFFEERGRAPCLTANDMIYANDDLRDFVGMFDDALLVTLNLAPVQEPAAPTQPPYTPFGKFQKACTFVQVIQDATTGHIKIKMLDPDDAGDVHEWLKGERAGKAVAAAREVHVGIYHLYKERLSLDLTDSQGIDLSNPQVKAEALNLIVQAKIIAGITSFNDEELPYLRTWAEKVGPENVYKLIGHVLNPIVRSDDRASYPSSHLAATLAVFGLPDIL